MIDNYSRLYEAWRREKQRIDIQPLQENFHAAIAEYIAQLREQTKTADKSADLHRSEKSPLIEHRAV